MKYGFIVLEEYMKSINEMKALSIAQPHAHNVFYGDKNVENRSRACNFRGTVAIYASKTLKKYRFENSSFSIDECSFGCIVGFVDIVDCIVLEEITKATKKHFDGPYGYILKNPRKLDKPIAVSPPNGAIAWWKLHGTDLTKCLNQIDLSSIKETKNIKSDKKRPVPKTSSRAKLYPTETLLKIVGEGPMNLKNAYEKLADYVTEKRLFFINDEDSKYLIECDSNLKKLFEKKKMEGDLKDLYSEMREFLFKNLNHK
jgi:hypothetical protein